MLNKHNLNIAKLTSKDEMSRFTINAILVTETLTVETDGHQLVTVSRPDAAEFPVPENYPETPVAEHAAFLLPVSDAAKIQSALPKKGIAHAAICTGQGENGTRIVPVLTNGGDYPQTHRVKVPSGSFPDYQRVIPPAAKATFKITLDPKLVRRLMEQFESFTKDQSKPSVEFYFSGEANAVRMDADGGEGQHMTAVLMPMRGDFPQVQREAQAKQAAA